jgi:hypothetical protein
MLWSHVLRVQTVGIVVVSEVFGLCREGEKFAGTIDCHA